MKFAFPTMFSTRKTARTGSGCQLDTPSKFNAAPTDILVDRTDKLFSDWENVIVSITRDAGGNWTPTSLLLGGHGSWWENAWTDLYTVASSEIGDNMLHQKTNNDHPKVYVSWSKHANFPDPDPERLLNLPFPYQSTCNAVRAQDWWGYVDLTNYIRADMSTEAGQWIQKTSWGAADSTPVRVHEDIGLCSIKGHATCSEWKDSGALGS
ncbi:hypothetical protein IG631_20014 [Alternaria alternata]|nr:hypothetical protein IG631_20014 [Alternaria alternata]